jgi:transposase InsO family protein
MIYFIRRKSDTVSAAEKFLADLAPYGKVKCLRSDNGTEFTSEPFQSLLLKHSIKHEKSAPYLPHQNGTAERGWRSIFEIARCLLMQAALPKNQNETLPTPAVRCPSSVTRYFARQLLNKHAKNYQNVEKITKFLLLTKVV